MATGFVQRFKGKIAASVAILSGNLTVNGLYFGSATDAITAHAGGGQGSATALTSQINRVTTVATIADSVLLPASTVGAEITVTNAATNSMNVFPQSGDAINALAANAAFAVAGGKTATFYCAKAGQWHSVLSA